jgi:ATP-binding cassette subfamily B protein
MDTLRAHATQRTVLLITHQLPLVRHADQILVLDHGRLAGAGPHAHLLAACAPYRTLWDAQRTSAPEGSR